jgi:hypothetical protein
MLNALKHVPRWEECKQADMKQQLVYGVMPCDYMPTMNFSFAKPTETNRYGYKVCSCYSMRVMVDALRIPIQCSLQVYAEF